MKQRALVFIGALILSIMMATSTVHASGSLSTVSVEQTQNEYCVWNVFQRASGFKPNAQLYLSVSAFAYSCENQAVTVGYADWPITTADADGTATIGIRHGDWGAYTFTIRDDYGNSATNYIEYGNPYKNPIDPTFTPTAVPQQPIITDTPVPNDNGGGGNPNPVGGCAGIDTRLHAGDIAWVSDYDPLPLNVRSGPATGNPIIFKVSVLELVTVIGEAQCMGDYAWLEIGYSGQTGYAIEVDRQGHRNLIKNGQPRDDGGGNQGSNPSNPDCGSRRVSLTIGEQGRVVPGGANNRLRSGPGTNYAEISKIPSGGVFTTIAGPDCGSGYEWWYVEYQGKQGWTASGNASEAWLENWGGSDAPRLKEVTGPEFVVHENGASTRLDYRLVVTYDQSGQTTRVRGVTLQFVVDPFSSAHLACWATANVDVIHQNGNVVGRDNQIGAWFLFTSNDAASLDIALFKDVGQKGVVKAAIVFKCSEYLSEDELKDASRSVFPPEKLESNYHFLELAVP